MFVTMGMEKIVLLGERMKAGSRLKALLPFSRHFRGDRWLAEIHELWEKKKDTPMVSGGSSVNQVLAEFMK